MRVVSNVFRMLLLAAFLIMIGFGLGTTVLERKLRGESPSGQASLVDTAIPQRATTYADGAKPDTVHMQAHEDDGGWGASTQD